ncbi:MAG: PadR family transcriptional regulator [Pseudomonadales bacterium]
MKRKDIGSSAYVVLGLTMQHEEITPYELKRRITTSVGYFWTYSHPQIYSVTERLTKDGLLTQHQEETGRRRKIYRITQEGEKVFRRWLADPVQPHSELRDLALLKLYFGEYSSKKIIATMASQQIDAHKTRLAEYRNIPQTRRLDEFAQATVNLGIEYEKMSVKYWQKVKQDYKS